MEPPPSPPSLFCEGGREMTPLQLAQISTQHRAFTYGDISHITMAPTLPRSCHLIGTAKYTLMYLTTSSVWHCSLQGGVD